MKKRDGKTVVNVDSSALECYPLEKERRARLRDSYMYGSQESFTKRLCIEKISIISIGMSIGINNSIYRHFHNIMQRE